MNPDNRKRDLLVSPTNNSGLQDAECSSEEFRWHEKIDRILEAISSGDLLFNSKMESSFFGAALGESCFESKKLTFSGAFNGEEISLAGTEVEHHTLMGGSKRANIVLSLESSSIQTTPLSSTDTALDCKLRGLYEEARKGVKPAHQSDCYGLRNPVQESELTRYLYNGYDFRWSKHQALAVRSVPSNSNAAPWDVEYTTCEEEALELRGRFELGEVTVGRYSKTEKEKQVVQQKVAYGLSISSQASRSIGYNSGEFAREVFEYLMKDKSK
jgi:hypothetical protein